MKNFCIMIIEELGKIYLCKPSSSMEVSSCNFFKESQEECFYCIKKACCNISAKESAECGRQSDLDN